jgi:hypothetical protein
MVTTVSWRALWHAVAPLQLRGARTMRIAMPRAGWWLFAATGACVVVLATASASPASTHPAPATVAGAGHTQIEGGTGGAAPQPVTTLLAFHATAHGGDFECLALAPDAAHGPGSATFGSNVMYVTGHVTSLTVDDDTATLSGVAVVTGIGAGPAQPFTVLVHPGGPGTTVQLTVSGLVFHEILIDGQITLR